MRSTAVLILSSWLALGMAGGPASGFDPLPDEKAIQRAMEQQRKAAEHEYRQQMEFEKKVMQEQQRAMHQQMVAQQRYAEQQQKALHEQQHQQNLTKANASKPPNPVVAATQVVTPVYHSTRAYYGHHYYGHPRSRGNSYTHYRTWPTQQNAQTLALIKLKRSLDAVKLGQSVTPLERSAIKHGLMGVVEVSKVPTVASIEQLSGQLAEGLAHREAGGAAHTGPMALSLRGILNSSGMIKGEVVEVMNEHRSALRTSKFRTPDVTSVMETLKVVSSQERANR